MATPFRLWNKWFQDPRTYHQVFCLVTSVMSVFFCSKANSHIFRFQTHAVFPDIGSAIRWYCNRKLPWKIDNFSFSQWIFSIIHPKINVNPSQNGGFFGFFGWVFYEFKSSGDDGLPSLRSETFRCPKNLEMEASLKRKPQVCPLKKGMVGWKMIHFLK